MPPNERRRNFKIVAPLEQDRSGELVGGLKNAMARGESLEKAKQTFLSSGYKPEEVNAAAQLISTELPAEQFSKAEEKPITQQQNLGQQEAQQQKPEFKKLSNITNEPPKQPKQASKGFIIALAIGAISVLVGAAIIGLFWDKWF
jgi:hypothetical protein